jgi:hypothetical protein
LHAAVDGHPYRTIADAANPVKFVLTYAFTTPVLLPMALTLTSKVVKYIAPLDSATLLTPACVAPIAKAFIVPKELR